MANSISVDKLVIGTTMHHITVRLLRMWEARNFKKNGELMSFDLLLIDSMDCLVQASIHHRNIPRFKPLIKEGQIYRISNFDVVQAYERYKVTDNKITIRFTDNTIMKKCEAPELPIKEECFRLLDYSTYFALANTNLQLPDVVGQILSVQGPNLGDTTSTQKIVLLLLLKEGSTVRLTIWDQQASDLRQQLSLQGNNAMVIVCTCLNPKLFAGTLYLNSTGATKFYFDSALDTITEFMRLMGLDHNSQLPIIENEETRRKEIETLTVKALLEYVSSSTRQLIQGLSSFTCPTCTNSNPIGVLKFRVELMVVDENTSTRFVIFDHDTRKLTNQKAEDILAVQGTIPRCIEDLVGRSFAFQLKIREYNFTSSYQAFTVTRVLEEIEEKLCCASLCHHFEIKADHDLTLGETSTTKLQSGSEEITTHIHQEGTNKQSSTSEENEGNCESEELGDYITDTEEQERPAKKPRKA